MASPKKDPPNTGHRCTPAGGYSIDPKNENLRQAAAKILALPSVIRILKQHKIYEKIRRRGRRPVLLAQYPAEPPPGSGGPRR